jgi:MFS family permease
VAGQAVVWYTGQFYALFFLTKVLQVDLTTANILIAVALLIGTPFFVVFGALSDRVGRKPIIMAGLLLAVLTYFPLFHALTQAANPDLALAQAKAEVVVTAARRDCSFGGNPVARAIDFRTSCDIAKRFLAQNSVSYKNASAMGGHATVRIGDTVITAPSGRVVGQAFDAESEAAIADFKKVSAALKAAGYPAKADPAKMNKPLIVAILAVLVVYVAMVYGRSPPRWWSCSPPASATPR